MNNFILKCSQCNRKVERSLNIPKITCYYCRQKVAKKRNKKYKALKKKAERFLLKKT